MSVEWVDEEAVVRIDEVPGGKRRIEVTPVDPDAFIAQRIWETHYPLSLIRAVFDVKGPFWLCDEIMRDEYHAYLRFDKSVLGYVDNQALVGKTILDFGCGPGGSTVNLARMFPHSRIIGVELLPEFADLARRRAAFYGHEHVTIMLSPCGDELPKDLAEVDYIVMEGVYEHLLPRERINVMGALWSLLRPGGILFVTLSPNRNFPIESHTTRLPLLNYMPDRLAFWYARRFASRVGSEQPWEELLRQGIRGASVRQIKRVLSRGARRPPILLEPCREGLRDSIDIWYEVSGGGGTSKARVLVKWAAKIVKRLFRANMAPYLMVAFKKPEP